MNKAILRILSIMLLIATGLAFALALFPRTAADSMGVIGAQARGGNAPAATGPALTPTPVPIQGGTGVVSSEPGSTDGIVILSYAIALIIVVPILLQRGLWIS